MPPVYSLEVFAQLYYFDIPRLQAVFYFSLETFFMRLRRSIKLRTKLRIYCSNQQ